MNESGLNVNTLSNEIRRVDGSNSLGAGALAEALMPFILSRTPAGEGDPDYHAMGVACERNGLVEWNGGEMLFQPPSDVIEEQAIRRHITAQASLTAGEWLAFARDFVREQSEGEWGDDLINRDAERLAKAILARLSPESVGPDDKDARIRDLEQALAHIANGNHPAHSGKGYLMDVARQALTPDPEKKP
jgi:hypothetical protein